MPQYIIPLAVFILLLFIAIGTYVCISIRDTPKLSEPNTDDNSASGPVDPWNYQRALMKASEQPMPDLPCVSHGSVLYYALILEELAETGRPMLMALQRILVEPKTGAEEIIIGKLTSIISRMDESSAIIKGALKSMPTFSYALDEAEAIELLDGVTDVQVVNSGLGLASGLPAQTAYAEVVISNLSKINPKTGKIDKTPDGKWVKGVYFKLPDLGAVLKRHREFSTERIKQRAALDEVNEDTHPVRVASTVGE